MDKLCDHPELTGNWTLVQNNDYKGPQTRLPKIGFDTSRPPDPVRAVAFRPLHANRERESAQPDGAFINDGLFVFRIRFAVAFTAENEFM